MTTYTEWKFYFINRNLPTLKQWGNQNQDYCNSTWFFKPCLSDIGVNQQNLYQIPLLKKKNQEKRDDQAQMITSCILLIVYILNLQYDILHRKKLLPKR